MDIEQIHAERDQYFNELQDTEEMVGDQDGTLTFQGERFNIMGADYFMADIFHMLQDLYGQGSGGILQQTGKSYGEDLVSFIDADEGDEAIGQLLGLLAFLGYSKPRFEDGDIIVPSSPTAEEHLQKDHEPAKTCYFLAGIIGGALEDIGQPHQVSEEACKADNDEHCRFSITEGR